MKNLKWWHWIFIIFGGLVLIGIILPEPDIEETTQEEEYSSAQDSTKEKEEKLKTSWVYSEDIDEMDNTETYYASTTSTNEVEFDFPYNGGSTFQLLIRNIKGKNEVIITVSKGQFVSSYIDNNVRVKFDDAQPVNYSYSESTSASADLIFINNSSAFISKLKKSKSLWVEATFFNEGNIIMKFDTEGFEWDR